MAKALITGITGQDGSYLAELLLSKGYEVHGLLRRVAVEDPAHRLWRIRHLLDRLHLHFGAMDSYASLFSVIEDVRPEECYHLAADSFVGYSFEEEFSPLQTNIQGTHYVLAALRRKAPACRFYFAGSSEMFGEPGESPQRETTAFAPRSPYGISKVAGFHLTRNFRQVHGMFACSGMLFNHESPRRGFEYVTRKISSGAARIKRGLDRQLHLGNLDAQRDWGYAPDYVEAMWRMLQRDAPEDYVIGTGQTHTVRQFAAKAFEALGLDWRQFVQVDPVLYRPAESHVLVADASKARRALGWSPTVDFEELVRRMVESDLDRVQKLNGP